MEASYFSVRQAGNQYQVNGHRHCALGHRLARGPGMADDGVFGYWDWDGRRLVAGNDRYGMYPLFYSWRDGQFAISPSIPSLLAGGAPAELDEAALAVYLRLGFFVGEDTPYRHIRALAPDTTLCWDGALELARGVRAGARAPLRIGRAAALEHGLELFRKALARRQPGASEVVLPLGGGLGARHILFELLRQGRAPGHCLSTAHFAPCGDAPLRAAKAITRELGLVHIVLAQRSSWFLAEHRKNLLTSFSSGAHARHVVAADYLLARMPVLYDGIGADMFGGCAALTPARLAHFDAGDTRPLAQQLLAADETALGCLLPQPLRARLSRERAIVHLEIELARHCGAPNPVGSFYFWNRTRRQRAMLPYGLLGQLPTVFAPFLDHALFDFLSALPARMLLDHALHGDAIRHAYPGRAHLAPESRHGVDTGAPQASFGRTLALWLLACGPSPLLRQRYLLASLLRPACHEHASLALYLHQIG
ncbi:MAG: asparagine synthetase B family protein [Pseudomonadota bacterium]